jgi:predicted acylesterase/phospholipase RssA/CRP-like cAMP-binding protein
VDATRVGRTAGGGGSAQDRAERAEEMARFVRLMQYSVHGVDTNAVVGLYQRLERIFVPKGGVVFQAHSDSPDGMYVITKGQVGMYAATMAPPRAASASPSGLFAGEPTVGYIERSKHAVWHDADLEQLLPQHTVPHRAHAAHAHGGQGHRQGAQEQGRYAGAGMPGAEPRGVLLCSFNAAQTVGENALIAGTGKQLPDLSALYSSGFGYRSAYGHPLAPHQQQQPMAAAPSYVSSASVGPSGSASDVGSATASSAGGVRVPASSPASAPAAFGDASAVADFRPTSLDCTRPVTCIALVDTTLLKLTRETFRWWTELHPQAVVSFILTTTTRQWRVAYYLLVDFFRLRDAWVATLEPPGYAPAFEFVDAPPMQAVYGYHAHGHYGGSQHHSRAQHGQPSQQHQQWQQIRSLGPSPDSQADLDTTTLSTATASTLDGGADPSTAGSAAGPLGSAFISHTAGGHRSSSHHRSSSPPAPRASSAADEPVRFAAPVPVSLAALRSAGSAVLLKQPGEVVYEEGVDADSVYVILAGYAMCHVTGLPNVTGPLIYSRAGAVDEAHKAACEARFAELGADSIPLPEGAFVTRRLGPGCVAGGQACFVGLPHRDTLVAVTNLEVAVFPRKLFSLLAERNPTACDHRVRCAALTDIALAVGRSFVPLLRMFLSLGLQRLWLKSGELLFKAGDSTRDGLYVVISGRLRTYVSEKPKGRTIAEMAGVTATGQLASELLSEAPVAAAVRSGGAETDDSDMRDVRSPYLASIRSPQRTNKSSSRSRSVDTSGPDSDTDFSMGGASASDTSPSPRPRGAKARAAKRARLGMDFPLEEEDGDDDEDDEDEEDEEDDDEYGLGNLASDVGDENEESGTSDFAASSSSPTAVANRPRRARAPRASATEPASGSSEDTSFVPGRNGTPKTAATRRGQGPMAARNAAMRGSLLDVAGREADDTVVASSSPDRLMSTTSVSNALGLKAAIPVAARGRTGGAAGAEEAANGGAAQATENNRERIHAYAQTHGLRVDVGRGETVGELSVLVREKRRAISAVCIRDCELVRITQASFELVARKYPAVMHQFTQVLARRYRELTAKIAGVQSSGKGGIGSFGIGGKFGGIMSIGSGMPSPSANRLMPVGMSSLNVSNASSNFVTIAVVPAGKNPPAVADFTQRLVAALERVGDGPVLHLTSAKLDLILGDGTADSLDQLFVRAKVAAWLSAQEEIHRFVIFEADPAPSTDPEDVAMRNMRSAAAGSGRGMTRGPSIVDFARGVLTNTVRGAGAGLEAGVRKLTRGLDKAVRMGIGVCPTRLINRALGRTKNAPKEGSGGAEENAAPAGPQATPWTSMCVQQCDVCLLVGQAHMEPDLSDGELACVYRMVSKEEATGAATPAASAAAKSSRGLLGVLIGSNNPMSPSKPDLRKQPTDANLIAVSRTFCRKELVLLHTEPGRRPSGTRLWIRQRRISAHHHVRVWREDDYGRVARLICGKGRGMVLGGGGSRGLAHLGAFKVLEEKSIGIDIIGGTSQGAFMGACYALAQSVEDCYPLANRLAQTLGNTWVLLTSLTLPILSYFSGTGLNEALQDCFRDTQIEDLWIPYFCVSTDVSNDTSAVHTTGPLWRYVRASMTVLGLLPPLYDRGRVLIDGGYTNNLPVEVLRSLSPQVSQIICIDVENKDARAFEGIDNYGDSLSGWYLAWRWLLSSVGLSSKLKIPPFSEITLKVSYISHSMAIREFLQHADDSIIYVRPNVGTRFGLLDYHLMPTIVSEGERAMRETLGRWEERQRQRVLKSLRRAARSIRAASARETSNQQSANRALLASQRNSLPVDFPSRRPGQIQPGGYGGSDSGMTASGASFQPFNIGRQHMAQSLQEPRRMGTDLGLGDRGFGDGQGPAGGSEDAWTSAATGSVHTGGNLLASSSLHSFRQFPAFSRATVGAGHVEGDVGLTL